MISFRNVCGIGFEPVGNGLGGDDDNTFEQVLYKKDTFNIKKQY